MFKVRVNTLAGLLSKDVTFTNRQTQTFIVKDEFDEVWIVR